MASIRENVSKDRSVTTFSVLYREGGRGTPQRSETFATRKQAERFRQLVELLGRTKALAEMSGSADVGLTVDDLAARFFDLKEGNVTERTAKDYRRDYDNWIKPELGHRQADSLDELDVQHVVDKMAKVLEAKTVADKHMILSSMFKWGSARTRRLVAHNPCLETELPKRKKKAPKGFSLVEWEAMHDWGKVHARDADDLLLFIASTGWRFSECTALTPAGVEDYGDVEVEHEGRTIVLPVVFVSVLGVHRRDGQDRIVYTEGEAKSSAGMRRINLPPDAAHMLRRRLTGRAPRALVFTSPTGKQWRSNNFLDREFASILAGAGIEKIKGMGPHFLRHTHVLMLDRAGVSAAKTQRRIGHSHISTTYDVYGGQIGNALSEDELLRLNDLVVRPPASNQVVTGEVVRGELS